MAEMYGGITPEMLNTVSRGTAAQSSLNGLANNPETIQALRNANTPYGQVQGQGFSSSAPGGLQVLGEIVNRNAGNQGIKKMQTQADALRGQIAKGSEQELMMELEMARAKDAEAKAAAKLKRGQEVADAKAKDQWEREKFTAQQAQAEKDRLAKIQAAEIRAVQDAGKNKSFNKPTAGQLEKFEKKAMEVRTLSETLDAYKPEFSSESGLPKVGTLQNFISQNSPILATKAMEEQQEWWGNYAKNYELVTRHALFGGALTAGEQQRWREANITPDMGAEQIAKRLETQRELQDKIAKYEAGNARIKGWDPDYIQFNYGDITDTGTDTPPPGSPATSTGGNAPQEAIDYLKANPEFRDQFEAKYGYVPG